MATIQRQAWCLLQLKLCDPCLSALKWFVYHARHYTSAQLFTIQFPSNSTFPDFTRQPNPCLMDPVALLIQILMHHFQLICIISMTEYYPANQDACIDRLLHSNSSEIVVSDTFSLSFPILPNFYLSAFKFPNSSGFSSRMASISFSSSSSYYYIIRQYQARNNHNTSVCHTLLTQQDNHS